MENTLDSSCFAYPAMRKYPIHTKEAALASYQDFCKESGTFAGVTAKEIEKQFQKAASFHEIELKPLEKQAAASRPVYAFKTGDGGYISMSKIATEDEQKQAASYILSKRAETSRSMLKEAAKYVIWCAANSELPLSSDAMKKVAQIAGVGVGDREEIEKELEKRATMNIFDGKDREDFWNYVNELKSMSDADFYKEATLNTVCDTLEGIDSLYNNQHRYGKDLKRPEEVCFSSDIDDLLKEASDLAYIESIDTTISKKALQERENSVNAFLKDYFGQKTAISGDALITKVASMDKTTATALLDAIE